MLKEYNCLHRYIVNFMLDSTLGLLIIWAGIRLAQHCARAYDIPLINFGEYGKCSTAFQFTQYYSM